MIAFRILGPLEVEADGRVLKLGGAQPRACSPCCSCTRTRWSRGSA